MCKILCIGDIHIKVDNIPYIQIFYNNLKTHLENNYYEFIVLMGDILHTHERLHTIPFNMAINFIKMVSEFSKTFVLVGNHDFINNSQILTTNHWMNCLKNLKNIFIIDTVYTFFFNNLKFIFSPYVPDGKFISIIENYDKNWKNSNIIFAHQLFDGVNMGILVKDVEEWKEEYPLLISGHIHDKQKINSKLIYTGSSMQHAFNESSNKTILEIIYKNNKDDNKNNEYIFNEIDLNLPKKKCINMTFENLINIKNEEDIKNLLNVHSKEYTKYCEYKFIISDNDIYSDNSIEFNKYKKTEIYKTLTKKYKIKIIFKHKKNYLENKKNSNKDFKLNNEKIDFNNILLNIISEDVNKQHFLNILNKIKNSREEIEEFFL